jgi:hypothetical protein
LKVQGPIMATRTRTIDRLFWSLAFGALLAAGCDGGGRVSLVPTFPSGEQDLLSSTGVSRLVVDLYAADGRDAGPKRSETLTRGEAIHLDGIGYGPWIISIRGLDDAGDEVVFGETDRFRIESGKTTDVGVFIGRPHAFNLVDFQPAEIAAKLNGLKGHAATPFVDESGKNWILVSGGFRDGEIASANAYLIDTSALTIEVVGAMSKPRLGHVAVAVEPIGRAPVVVIADGGSGPVTSLDVYDTAERTFRTIDVPCGPSRFAGLVPALVGKTGGALVPSGRVILPGAALCVVDPYGEQAAQTWPSPTGEEPAAPALSASNAAGQLIVVGADGLVWATSAVERSASETVCGGSAGTQWEGSLTARAGGALKAVGAADRFVLIGGSTAEGEASANDWSLVALSGCDVTAALEGTSGSAAILASPALLDLSQSDVGAPALDIVVTGGTSTERLDSDVLIGDGDALGGDTASGYPLWYGDRGEKTPSLRASRIGHAIAALSNRSAWVIGGNASFGAEIYEFGTSTPKLGVDAEGFQLRKPILTSMTVLNESSAANDLVPLIQDDSFLGALFDQDTTATVYLLGSADRGIGDDLNEITMTDNGNCEPNAVDTQTDITWGTVKGEVSGIDVPADVYQTDDSSDAIQKAKDAITSTMSGMKARVLIGAGDGTGGLRSSLAPENPIDTSCGWRQYARVGFDGLGLTRDATYAGVNVLVWVVTGDDCSQGWLAPSDEDVLYGETDTSELPSEDALASMACDDPDLDDYFGLPSDYLKLGELKQVIRDVAWNPRDLIVALVGKGTLENALPRRLSYLTAVLSDMGAAVVDMMVEDPADTTAFDAKISALSERISARNPYQVCVPSSIVGDLAAPYEADVIDDEGLFRPPNDNDPWTDEMLATIDARVRDRCRLFSVGSSEGLATRIAEITDGWRVATDTDLHGADQSGCDAGWTLQIDAAAVTEGDALFLQCLAN